MDEYMDVLYRLIDGAYTEEDVNKFIAMSKKLSNNAIQIELPGLPSVYTSPYIMEINLGGPVTWKVKTADSYMTRSEEERREVAQEVLYELCRYILPLGLPSNTEYVLNYNKEYINWHIRNKYYGNDGSKVPTGPELLFYFPRTIGDEHYQVDGLPLAYQLTALIRLKRDISVYHYEHVDYNKEGLPTIRYSEDMLIKMIDDRIHTIEILLKSNAKTEKNNNIK